MNDPQGIENREACPVRISTVPALRRFEPSSYGCCRIVNTNPDLASEQGDREYRIWKARANRGNGRREAGVSPTKNFKKTRLLPTEPLEMRLLAARNREAINREWPFDAPVGLPHRDRKSAHRVAPPAAKRESWQIEDLGPAPFPASPLLKKEAEGSDGREAT